MIYQASLCDRHRTITEINLSSGEENKTKGTKSSSEACTAPE